MFGPIHLLDLIETQLQRLAPTEAQAQEGIPYYCYLLVCVFCFANNVAIVLTANKELESLHLISY